MASPESPNTNQLIAELRRNNELMAQLVRIQSDWRLIARQGMITGFATVVGATILVSFLVWILQPLKRLSVLKPTLDRIAQELERRPQK